MIGPIAGYVVGSALSGYGERQGLKAMEQELEQQQRERIASADRRQKFVDTEYNRRIMAADRAPTGEGAVVRQNALAGAGSMAAGLGLSGADAAKLSGSMQPAEAVRTVRGEADVIRNGNTLGMSALHSGIRQELTEQEIAELQYARRLREAGEAGSGFRQVGSLVQGGSMVAGSLGGGGLLVPPGAQAPV